MGHAGFVFEKAKIPYVLRLQRSDEDVIISI